MTLDMTEISRIQISLGHGLIYEDNIRVGYALYKVRLSVYTTTLANQNVLYNGRYHQQRYILFGPPERNV